MSARLRGKGQPEHISGGHAIGGDGGGQAVFSPADAQTLSAGNLNELTGILRGNPRVMSMREEFKRL